jgi:hypothetical protein
MKRKERYRTAWVNKKHDLNKDARLMFDIFKELANFILLYMMQILKYFTYIIDLYCYKLSAEYIIKIKYEFLNL